jgi:DNA polymerase II
MRNAECGTSAPPTPASSHSAFRNPQAAIINGSLSSHSAIRNPHSASVSGWLFDLYPTKGGMVLWIVDEAGGSHRLTEAFEPVFYAAGTRRDLAALGRALAADGLARPLGPARRREFWTGAMIDVAAFALGDPEAQPRLLRRISTFTAVTFFDCDLPLALQYGHHRKVFPAARVTAAHDDRSRLLEIAAADSPWDLEYAHPPLRRMALTCQGDELGRGVPTGTLRVLEVQAGDEVCRIDDGDPAALIAELNRLIHRHDPHILFTRYGDAYLVPTLLLLARRAGIPLDLDREVVCRRIRLRGHSYFSYGRILYQAPFYPCFGRWHIDAKNSFLLRETRMQGVVELSRLSRIPVQKMARTSPGSAISGMQLDRALSEGILVPWKKGEPERWKSAWELFVADKGGLVYQPLTGLHQGVAEIDFASMYPAMMVRHNISPETVGCACCAGDAAARVPEIGIAVCRRREGLVTRTLRPILERRAAYKALRRAAAGERRAVYDQRQTALKWILVTCFGYLGYRNARFGRIEAHEAVTAWSREKLIQAREVCEAHGFRVLHAIVDALWIQKDGATEEELAMLCRRIQDTVGIPIALEGVYKWIAFLPSRVSPRVPVVNRYLGAFADGETKVRGIDLRRSDTPPLVTEAQERMIALLAEAPDAAGYRARVPAVLDVLADYALRLWEGRARLEDLTVTKTISRKPEEYRHDTLSALAAKQLARKGIAVHPGEAVRYVIQEDGAADKAARARPLELLGDDAAYDAAKYVDLLVRAAETVLGPCGYDAARLRRYLDLIRKQERESRVLSREPRTLNLELRTLNLERGGTP